MPLKDRAADHDHSPVLEAWGSSLYDAVAPDLRPAVLQLAFAAASRRPKKDVPTRFADWIGRAELAEWYTATGLAEAAAMVRSRPAITDPQTFLEYWPTGAHSYEWRVELDSLASRLLSDAGKAPDRKDYGAADYLAENGVMGVEQAKIAGIRENLRSAIGAITAEEPPGFPLPDRGELNDLRAIYLDPMWALARPVTRQTANVVCELAGWDQATPPPPHSHPLQEIGFTACTHAAYVALIPLEHAAHLREIRAFRRIALGLPVDA